MREIKFKFYDKKTNKLVEECGMWWNYSEMLNREDVNVCEFTGLKDKNGKDIYESDLVKFESGVIVSVTIDYFYNSDYEDQWSGIGWNVNQENVKECEIIGNIYENSNLQGV